LPSIESRLRSASSRQARNADEQKAKLAEVGQAKASLKKAESVIRRYDRSLPKLKAELDISNMVVEVGKELHKKVRLHISILAISGSHTLELVRFGDIKLAQASAIMVTP
jgi:hypothetical protein